MKRLEVGSVVLHSVLPSNISCIRNSFTFRTLNSNFSARADRTHGGIGGSRLFSVLLSRRNLGVATCGRADVGSNILNTNYS